MKNMKKTYIWAITLVIAGLMIASAVSIPAATVETKTSSVVVEKLDMEKQTMQMALTGEKELKQMPMPLDTNPAFAFEDDQLHPGFGRSFGGTHMAAYRDEAQSNVIFTFSADDGVSYDPGVYYDTNSDYPSIKLWGGERFFGTMVPNYEDCSGAAAYVFETTDPTDSGNYALTYWDWSSNGWYDFIDMEIAVDDSAEDWAWGFNAIVASSTYSGCSPNPYIDGPFINYQTDDAGMGTISWYNNLPGCDHADAAIDHVTAKTYAVYDHDNGANFELLVRNDDFTNWDGAGSLSTINGASNLTYPAVAANDDDMIILAETDENGNKDIICIYGNVAAPSTSFVIDSVDDEMFPDVRHVQDDKFVCTYVSDGKLYTSVTEDAGATWSTAEEIDDDVVEEYKTADICDYANYAMYEFHNGDDIDIYLGDLPGGIQVPIFEVVSITGGIGVTATIKNVGTAAATNVDLNLVVAGGILGLINKDVNNTVASLAIDEEVSISSGLIIGLGAIDIDVSATCDEGTSISGSASGTQLFILSRI